MYKILVVEDDVTINQVVCEFLKDQHYDVIPAFDGKEAFDIFLKEHLDLIILDIMIPSMSGIDLLKEIRKISEVSVLILTAVDDEYTQLISFDHLISDFVTKPFSPLILMKRVENILRNKLDTATISLDEIAIFAEKGIVRVNGQEINLTHKEYEILLLLAQNKGHILSRDYIMNSIWGYTELDSRVLDNHMKNLRKKLPKLRLKTIIGRGYQIEG